MLMADFVPQTAGTVGLISKGVGWSGTFDVFYDGATTKNFPEMGILALWQILYTTLSSSSTAKFTAFGHAFATNARDTDRTNAAMIGLESI